MTLRSGRLKLELKVLNSGDQPLGFTAALHTYLEVVDVGVPAVRVTGLQGKKYLDKVPDPKKPEEKARGHADTAADWRRGLGRGARSRATAAVRLSASAAVAARPVEAGGS